MNSQNIFITDGIFSFLSLHLLNFNKFEGKILKQVPNKVILAVKEVFIDSHIFWVDLKDSCIMLGGFFAMFFYFRLQVKFFAHSVRNSSQKAIIFFPFGVLEHSLT